MPVLPRCYVCFFGMFRFSGLPPFSGLVIFGLLVCHCFPVFPVLGFRLSCLALSLPAPPCRDMSCHALHLFPMPWCALAWPLAMASACLCPALRMTSPHKQSTHQRTNQPKLKTFHVTCHKLLNHGGRECILADKHSRAAAGREFRNTACAWGT